MELILILQNICGVLLILKLVLQETSKKILQYLTKFYLVNIAIILKLNVSLEEKRGIEMVLKRYFLWNCVTQILKLVLILQNASSRYWNWYWYCKILWGSIEIDIDIAKCIGGVLKLILILQNALKSYWNCYWYCKILFQILMSFQYQKNQYRTSLVSQTDTVQ